MDSFSAIVDAVGTLALAQECGVADGTPVVWKHRDKIPDHFWLGTVAAAKIKKVKGVTLELLAELAKRKREAA